MMLLVLTLIAAPEDALGPGDHARTLNWSGRERKGVWPDTCDGVVLVNWRI